MLPAPAFLLRIVVLMVWKSDVECVYYVYQEIERKERNIYDEGVECEIQQVES